MRLSKIIIFLLLTVSLAAWSKPIVRAQVHMGTFVSVELQEKNKNLFVKVFSKIQEVDKKLSDYKVDSEISRLNKKREIEASKEVVEVLRTSLEVNRLSRGHFDISLGAMTREFEQYIEKTKNQKNKKSISKFLEKTGSKFIEITGNKVKLKRAGVKIDLGGIGKGYAVDFASEALEKNGVDWGRISASGDTRCFHKCDFSVQNPFVESGHFGLLTPKVTHLSMSTSGNYRKFVETKKMNHLLNPKTGSSQQIFASVTVFLRRNNTLADAYATAASTMRLKEAVKFLKAQKANYILLLNDGRRIRSPGLEAWLSLDKSEIASFKQM